MMESAPAKFHFRALEAHQSETGNSVCVLERDVKFRRSRLEQFCWEKLQPIDVDLLVLASVVASADRAARRDGSRWSRDISLSVPVHEPGIWNAASVAPAFADALRFLTGDCWHLEFRKRIRKDAESLQLFLPKAARSDSPAILPYSGGLDSFLELQRLRADPKQASLFVVTTENGSETKEIARGTVSGDVSRAGVPVEIGLVPHAEMTYRSRTFLFYSVGAIAWKLTSGSRIIVAENGQGSVGPSVVQFGNEHPYRATHPGFTSRLSIALERIWGRRPKFEHPHVWRTKASALRLVGANALLGWEKTRSCSRNLARHKGSGVPRQCGVCGNCLLRRSSASVALGHGGTAKEYAWWDLNADTLADAAHGRVATTDNDLRIASFAVLSQKHLAAAAAFEGTHPTLDRASHELAIGLGIPKPEAAKYLTSFLTDHRRDWVAFLSTLSPDGWVGQLGNGG
jgi:hypothetical protein